MNMPVRLNAGPELACRQSGVVFIFGVAVAVLASALPNVKDWFLESPGWLRFGQIKKA
jgi:hypothetical protein